MRISFNYSSLYTQLNFNFATKFIVIFKENKIGKKYFIMICIKRERNISLYLLRVWQ